MPTTARQQPDNRTAPASMENPIHWNPTQFVIDILEQQIRTLKRNIKRVSTAFFRIAKYLPIPTGHSFHDRGYDPTFTRRKIQLLEQKVNALNRLNPYPHIFTEISADRLGSRSDAIASEVRTLKDIIAQSLQDLKVMRQNRVAEYWLIAQPFLGPGRGSTESLLEGLPETLDTKLFRTQLALQETKQNILDRGHTAPPEAVTAPLAERAQHTPAAHMALSSTTSTQARQAISTGSAPPPPYQPSAPFKP